MSLLRQGLLFSDQKAMESTYAMARVTKPYLNDYIKKIDDLELLLDLIPKALYRPIFNTLTQNFHTSKITAT